jgi:hypothetical protein
MKSNGERSLKSLNMKWLVLLAAADILFVLLFIAPDLLSGVTLSQIGIGRISITTVMPVIVLLIVNVLPHDVKSMLVYWKPLGVLPGCEAFTKYGPRDPRIDMAALKKNVGTLPMELTEQNSKWYKLYKQVSNEPEVQEAHKLFLMYRDMAVLSLPLLVLVPLSLNVAGASNSTLGLAVGMFSVQFLLTALSARWSGIRFVCNVLAIHSARKIATPKASAPVQPST